jgi:hypothetical protein
MAEVNQSDRIDFSRIRQPKVKSLLIRNGIHSLNDLSRLVSLCHAKNEGKQFHKHLKSFVVDASIEKVWKAYKTVSPEESANGKMVSFGMMYSRDNNKITYSGDVYSGMQPGQIIFLNLNLFAGLAHLAVGHEITNVFEDKRHIEICYLQNGASVGTQLIQLKRLSDTQTEVLHETWYTSGSWFRDKILYPTFHTRGITEFHHAVKRKAEQL